MRGLLKFFLFKRGIFANEAGARKLFEKVTNIECDEHVVNFIAE